MSLVFACLAAAAVDGATIRCRNIQPADGQVRLAGIEAPARGTPQGRRAQELLNALLTGRIECRQVDAMPGQDGFQETDARGRMVARCSVAGRDLGELMLRAAQVTSTE